MRPLVILTADGTMNAVFTAFFNRPGWHQTLGCHPFELRPEQDILYVPGQTDGAIHNRAHEFLRPYLSTHDRALVVLDQQFGGERPAAQVRDDIVERMNRNGWSPNNDVVVIDPELEVWLWQDKPQIARAVGHTGQPLRAMLRESGEWPAHASKPTHPKDTLQQLIRTNRAGAPMAVYTRIVKAVGVKGCDDAAFHHFRDTLRGWFPAAE